MGDPSNRNINLSQGLTQEGWGEGSHSGGGGWEVEGRPDDIKKLSVE
jgi:hypothetical protein